MCVAVHGFSGIYTWFPPVLKKGKVLEFENKFQDLEKSLIFVIP